MNQIIFGADVTGSVSFLQLISVLAGRKGRRRGCLPDTNPQPFPYGWVPICRPPSHQRTVRSAPPVVVRQLTLPTSKEGGFLLQRSPPGKKPCLTQSPQAYRFGCVPPYQIISYDSKRRPSFRMFFAAFKSTSWIAPQQGHSHCSLKRLRNALFRYPQTLQTCVLGNKASICTNGLCCHAHL